MVSIVCAIGVYVSAGNEGVVVFIVNLVVGVSGDVSDLAIVVVGFGNYVINVVDTVTVLCVFGFVDDSAVVVFYLRKLLLNLIFL